MLHHTAAPTHIKIHAVICPASSQFAALHVSAKVIRVGQDRDRALVFRGWSRLCLHAASLSAAEGASAAATATTRATRADAMETEAASALEKAEACHASVNMAASREHAKREAAELQRRKEAVDQVLREQRKHRAKMLVRQSGAKVPPTQYWSLSSLAAFNSRQNKDWKKHAPCCVA